MIGTVAVVSAILIAAGVLLVLGFLWISTLKEKVRERNPDYFKIKIKEKEKIAGVPVITVDVYDSNSNIKSWLCRRLTDIHPLIDSYIKLDMLCMSSLMGIFRQIIFPNSRIEIIAMLKENRFFIIREASILNIYKQSATNAITISENLSNKENIIKTGVNDAYFLVMTDQDLNTKKTFCFIARRTSSEFMEKCNDDVTELKFDIEGL